MRAGSLPNTRRKPYCTSCQDEACLVHDCAALEWEYTAWICSDYMQTPPKCCRGRHSYEGQYMDKCCFPCLVTETHRASLILMGIWKLRPESFLRRCVDRNTLRTLIIERYIQARLRKRNAAINERAKLYKEIF